MSDFIRVDFSDLHGLDKAIIGFQKAMLKAFPVITKKAAGDLLRDIRRNIGERPGPHNVTGNYRSSWYMTFEGGEAYVNTRHPAYMRLEHGYTGIDSLGRHYNQPAYPHVAPAVRRAGKAYPQEVRRRMMKEWVRQ